MNTTPDQDRLPNPVDLHVGARIRMRRKILGVSQERLADDLGLTFQQVQKYERGANRVSASKLYEIAKSLQSPVSYFFEGLADPTDLDGFSENGSEQFVHDFLMTPEGLELAALFPRIGKSRVRRRILDLVRSMAEDLVEDDAEV
ncbi:Cro/Cl family transcriptional regulator [Caulobacter sp. Root655]|jgi:transcriptional regulator with XRE-family HTH domain|uniref:helix-turn-helix domain-containing protein n=1 Tax=Caulobacter sp. Root655 TaxID=1736578 RepID=UPI0006FB7830|nr:helix-turn-helix domain-containing protein [Caulobacter sp. Root655]KRA56128.1 Cro/Cl family transcriptional regulator [Caulobacter sp. Root655]